MGGDFSYVAVLVGVRAAVNFMLKAPDAIRDSQDAKSVGPSVVFNRSQQLGLLAIFALLLIFRLPHAWAGGRFQDEEATVFLAYAWHYPWLNALFRSFAGYWNFAANASTVVLVQLVRAGILPLERAPYFTMTLGLVGQLLPAALILTGHASWLRSRYAVVAALLVIAISPSTEEVFFNVLHIQFQLALCTAIILSLDLPQKRFAVAGYGLILFLAPLCGPGVIVILPLFALRALIDRQRGRLIQLGVFAAGAAVQLLLFYGPSFARGHVADPITVASSMFLRSIVLPAVGAGLTNHLGSAMYFSQHDGGTGWWWFAGEGVILFGVLLVVALRRRDAAIWLLLSGLSISAASLGFGMVIAARVSYFRVGDGERYNFLPNVLIGLALIALAVRSNGRSRAIFSALCLVILVNGAIQYRRPLRDFADGPSWSAEVQEWRRDHHHPMAVWPRPWVADLSDEPHHCLPPPNKRGRAGDPRYCESGWLAGFYSDP